MSPNLLMYLYHYFDAANASIGEWFASTILHTERRVVNTCHGRFLVNPLSNFGKQLLNGQRDYEPQLALLLKTHLSAGSVFMDLGANEGYFSVIASLLVFCGQVFAIEPQPRCHSIISMNLHLNGCENVIILPVAVSDFDGQLKLYLHPATNTGATSIMKISRLPVRSIKVNCLTLQSLMDTHGINQIDLLKVDIEGAESKVILGSKTIFRNGRVRVIAIEYHPKILARQGLEVSTIHDFLLESGYVSNEDYNTEWSELNQKFVVYSRLSS